jgi:predicted transcriptional regulator/sporulation protein YlmC with PRC-barrel domain
LDSADKVIGRIKDVLIMPKAGEYAPLRYLMVQEKKHKKMVYIPYEYVETFSHEEVSLRTVFRKIPVRESPVSGSIFLKEDILDKQIVDMKGARVVRVNDLRIGDFDGKMCVLGIDISTRGLLRRLSLGWIDIFDLMKVHLIDWREAQPVHRTLKLDKVAENLKRLHPADLANVIEDLSIKHGSKLMKSLDAKAAAKVLEEVEPDLQKILVKYLGPEQAADILGQMSIEEIVDLMKMLTKGEAKRFLSQMENGKVKNIVEKLLVYPDDTAGGLMTVDYMSVRPNWTVAKVIEEVKNSTMKNFLIYIYVTDENGYFHGVVSLRWILISHKDIKMKQLLKKIHSHTVLRVNHEINEIIEIMTRYNLFTAAVLDEKKRMVGVVTIDDVMRHLFPNA